jgi:DNA replicative helicase MCM subunit Mcm2 (Cdc46/Mcm family)
MDEQEFNDLLRQQRLLAGAIMQESSMNNKIKLLDIINELVTQRNKKIHIESVIVEAVNNGFTEKETYDLLEELKRDHLVYETTPGFLQRTKDIKF